MLTHRAVQPAAPGESGCPSSEPGCPGYHGPGGRRRRRPGQTCTVLRRAMPGQPASPRPCAHARAAELHAQEPGLPRITWLHRRRNVHLAGQHLPVPERQRRLGLLLPGLARASTSACAADPFNGNTNIYDSGTTWSDLWQGLKASPKLALIMLAVESPVFGAPELSAGEDLAAGAPEEGGEAAPQLVYRGGFWTSPAVRRPALRRFHRQATMMKYLSPAAIGLG
jgi:hypothetical protein